MSFECNQPVTWSHYCCLSLVENNIWCLYSDLFFFDHHLRTLFHYLQSERKGEKGILMWERNILWLPPICAQTGNRTCNLSICPDWKSNLQLLVTEEHSNWAIYWSELFIFILDPLLSNILTWIQSQLMGQYLFCPIYFFILTSYIIELRFSLFPLRSPRPLQRQTYRSMD